MDATEQFGTLAYTLSPAIAPFAIESATGRIYVSSTGLDYETTKSYSTNAIVSDGTVPDTTVAITIFITGSNEFAPKADPSGALTPVSPADVLESTPTGSKVATLNFVDDDDGIDGKKIIDDWEAFKFLDFHFFIITSNYSVVSIDRVCYNGMLESFFWSFVNFDVYFCF